MGQILGAFPDTTRYDVPSLPVMQSEISDFAILYSNGFHSLMLLPSRRRIELKKAGPRSTIASAKRAVQNTPLLPIKFRPGFTGNEVESDDHTSPLDATCKKIRNHRGPAPWPRCCAPSPESGQQLGRARRSL
jgi:hypothetical protein